jgi:Ni2+-binding GTPase involved in maturation of urease and hydrogenase
MFERGVRLVNADVPIVHVSCRTGEGVDEWLTGCWRRSTPCVIAGSAV